MQTGTKGQLQYIQYDRSVNQANWICLGISKYYFQEDIILGVKSGLTALICSEEMLPQNDPSYFARVIESLVRKAILVTEMDAWLSVHARSWTCEMPEWGSSTPPAVQALTHE
jgi:hypothetical protein